MTDEGKSGENQSQAEEKKVDLTDPAIQEAINKEVAEQKEAYEKARKDYVDYTATLQAEMEKAKLAKPSTPAPDPDTDGQRWFNENVTKLQEDYGLDTNQAKGVVQFTKGSLMEMAGAFRGELQKMREEHQKALDGLQTEMKKYTQAPARLLRDAEFENPEVAKGVRLNDLSPDLKDATLKVLEQYDIPVALAAKIAGADKSLPDYIEHQRREKERAETVEGLPGAGGGVRAESLPLPGNLETAGLSEFLEQAKVAPGRR